MIWFISDTHFNHDRDFIYGPRGFPNVKEADATIIKNWNNMIDQDDDVYMIGDFFLGSDFDYIKNTLRKLKGKIHLVIGNHDTNAKLEYYKTVPNIVEIVWATQITYKHRQFYLSHYPTLTADLQSDPDRCVFNLFGHTHSKEKFFEDKSYMYNVAVDAHDNKPVSIETVYSEIMNKLHN